MKYTISVLGILLLLMSQNVNAQSDSLINQEDKAQIEQTIQNYFDGWMTGDTTLLSSAMHRTCHLKFIKNGSLVMMNKTRYLSNFKPKPKPKGMAGTIKSIHITRVAAAAQIELDTPTWHYTDYFNLLKDDGRWYIVDKISSSIKK